MLDPLPPECHRLCFFPEWWTAHHHPDEPLAVGARLCDCEGCMRSLRAAAEDGLDIGLVLKTDCDSIVVTAEYAVEAVDRTGGLDALCYVRNDYLREVYVTDQFPPLRPRWYSTAMAAHAGFAAACRRHATRADDLVGFLDVDHPRMPVEP